MNGYGAVPEYDELESYMYRDKRVTQPEHIPDVGNMVEPVAWMNDSGSCFLSDGNKYSENWTALYTSPQKREPLSDRLTANMFNSNKKATNAACYWAGVSDAEKAHGIGGEE